MIDFDQLLQSAKTNCSFGECLKGQIEELARIKTISQLQPFTSTAAGFITTLDIREGDYVMEGGTIVKSWLIYPVSGLKAQVYTSQLATIDRNSIATVQLPDF